ncbi:hypothetical protein TI04_13425 [Achromatium sp. WMS2]|nr:hypothetical protein TI04_13425 [Achromatium sp. WMS2]
MAGYLQPNTRENFQPVLQPVFIVGKWTIMIIFFTVFFYNTTASDIHYKHIEETLLKFNCPSSDQQIILCNMQ